MLNRFLLGGSIGVLLAVVLSSSLPSLSNLRIFTLILIIINSIVDIIPSIRKNNFNDAAFMVSMIINVIFGIGLCYIGDWLDYELELAVMIIFCLQIYKFLARFIHVKVPKIFQRL